MLSNFEDQNIGLYRASFANSATSLLENEAQSMSDNMYLSMFNSANQDEDEDYDSEDDEDDEDEDEDEDEDDEDEDSDFDDDEGEEDDE